MSNTKETKSPKIRDVRTCSRKLNHIRKLNFGQSILDLNVVNRVGEQKGNCLVIDNNVTRIPCTEKAEFVRKWVETHGEHVFPSDEESSSRQTSPILGSSATKRAKSSPVLGHRRKRARGKASVNNSTIRSIDSDYQRKDDISKEPEHTVLPANDRVNSISDDDSKENECSSCTPVRSRMIENELSPVLVNDRRLIRRKKRRLHDKRKPMALTECNYRDTNMNSVILRNDTSHTMYLKKDYKIVTNEKQQMLLKKLEVDMTVKEVEPEAEEQTKNLSSSIIPWSPVVKTMPYITKDSPDSVEDCMKIEVDSSNEAKDNVLNELETIKSDSDKTQSDIIEDVDTQDEFLIAQKPCSSNDSPSLPNSASQLLSQAFSKDSQKSTFSLAKEDTVQSLVSSGKISEVLTPVNESTDQSNRTDIISIVTSPQRTDSDSAKYLTILDSCKKRRRVKKGSLSERLQSLVNRQSSFVRIWRYQMKQAAKGNVSVQYVTVCIQTCTIRFNRQFSEGFVIDDPFDLLPRVETKDKDKSESRSKSIFYRPITIMTIPEIVGRLEIRKSDCVVRISPPWEVIEDPKLFLHVTYINKLESGEKVDVEQERIKHEESKEKVVCEFDCPCIQANALNPVCTERTNRPNVMEALFTR